MDRKVHSAAQWKVKTLVNVGLRKEEPGVDDQTRQHKNMRLSKVADLREDHVVSMDYVLTHGMRREP